MNCGVILYMLFVSYNTQCGVIAYFVGRSRVFRPEFL
jgi:hypothetical protein